MLVEVGDTQRYDSCYGCGLLLIFGNILCVKVTFRVPDLPITEVVALEVLGRETNGRNALNGEYRRVCTTRCCRLLAWLTDFYLKWVIWAYLLDRFADLDKVVVHRLWNGDAYWRLRTAITVE